jgi:AraC-like DNA-binding protein
LPTIDDIPDAVSDVLGLVRMRGEFVCESEAAAPWSVRIQRPGSHMHVVQQGFLWLQIDGEEKPLRVAAGELIILPHGGAHVLSSDPRLRPIMLEQAIAEDARRDTLVFHMGAAGVETRLMCARFYFAGVLAARLLAVLPKLIHVAPAAGRPLEWLSVTSAMLANETRAPRAGAALVMLRLLDLLFIQAVREWGATGPGERGWLSGLGDEHIGRALSAMHEEPSKNWTVEDLAEIAALSRSAFAARFTAVVGETPLRYLATWRLNLAAHQLRGGPTRIAEIARNVGYGSEAALTRAFKVRFGETPTTFRKSTRNGLP